MEDNIEIVEYKNINRKFSNEKIHEFINFNMHKFIGKPLKRRDDVINIQKYYIEKGGNFWIAIDKGENKIVGTIAFEKRNEKGILKRLYVDENYQYLGIGNKLYTTLEKYIIDKTNIKILYLACGKVLKNAHKFYKKHGFEQVDNMEIEMKISQEDDYFRKNIEI